MRRRRMSRGHRTFIYESERRPEEHVKEESLERRKKEKWERKYMNIIIFLSSKRYLSLQ